MQEVRGDIWELAEGAYLGVPTNQVIKYQTPRGELTMGAGIALQAKRRFPELPVALAARIRAGGNFPYDLGMWCQNVNESRRSWGVVSIPTKYHWKGASDLSLIRLSILRLVTLVDQEHITLPIYLPRLGCGHGGLDWRTAVKPALETCCLSDQFILVSNEEAATEVEEDRQHELF